MNSHSRSKRLLFPALALFGTFLALLPTITRADSPPLHQAWEQVQQAGSYHIVADVSQEILPRPTQFALSIGQQPIRRLQYALEGDVAGPGWARLRLWGPESSSVDDAMRVLLAGGQTYLWNPAMEQWEEGESPVDGTLPRGDFMLLLEALQVEDVLPSVERNGEIYTRYRVSVNGPRYAELVRRQMEASLANELPPEVELSPSPRLQQLRGMGEIWLDLAGYPARQIIELVVPRVTDDYGTKAQLDVAFSRFGQPIEPPIRPPDAPETGTGDPASALQTGAMLPAVLRWPDEHPSSLHTSLAFLFALVLLSLLRYRRVRQVYVALVTIVIFSMTLGLLLRTSYIARAFDNLNETHATSENGNSTLSPAARLVRDIQTEFADPPLAMDVSYHPEPALPPTSIPWGQMGPTSGQPVRPLDEVDSDFDGLNDDYEQQIGTSPYAPDTDGDTVTDTLEVQGFDYGGHHWHLNPNFMDTNKDGLTDGQELPIPYGKRPAGNWDTDGDSIPDVWDEDNDGDRVPDGVDLSPFARTAALDGRYYNLSINPGQHDGPIYIQLQVRPVITRHLRFFMRTMDWPSHDDQGQVQDRDESNDDMTLVPMLRAQSNVAPDEIGRSKYGMAVITDTENAFYPYTILLPLSADRNVAGDIVAFHAKAFYTGLTERVDWRARLVWVVHASLDSENDQGNIETDEQPIIVYEDPFFVTGVLVTRHEGITYGAFSYWDSERRDDPVIRLNTALEMSFMKGITPTVQQVVERVNSGNPANVWDLDPLPQATGPFTFTHPDEAIATMAMTVTRQQILASFSHDITPTLLFIQESTFGAKALDEGDTYGQVGTTFNVALDDLVIATEHGAILGQYAYDPDVDAWRQLDLNGVLAEVMRRWGDTSDEDDLLLARLYMMAWTAGQARTVEINGIPISYSKPDYDEIALTLKYGVKEVLGQLKEFLKFRTKMATKTPGGDQGVVAFYKDQLRSGLKFFKEHPKWGITLVAIAVIVLVALYVFKGYDYTVELASRIYTVYDKVNKVIETYNKLKGAKNLLKAGPGTLKVQVGMATAIAVVEIIIIWYVLYQFASSAPPGSPVVWIAYGQAIAASILVIIFFVLALTGVGLVIIALFMIVDFLFWLITGRGLKDRVVEWLGDLLVDVVEVTAIEKVDLGAFSMALWNQDDGVRVGNVVYMQTTFTGTIKKAHSSATYGDLDASALYGTFASTVTQGTDYGIASGGLGDSGCTTDRSNDRRICVNYPAINFYPARHGVNVKILNNLQMFYRLRYYPEVVGIDGDKQTMYGWVNSEKDDWFPIYFDVFPETVGELWDWSSDSQEVTVTVPLFGQTYTRFAHVSPYHDDDDADGLTSKLEEQHGTSPDNWDSDGDGISDGAEVTLRERYERLAPLSPDSDGDGLTDLEELRWNTDPTNFDTDNDGLTDTLEITGWEVDYRGFYTNTWAFSNPQDADTDNDGLTDNQEYEARTNPRAATVAVGGKMWGRPDPLEPGDTLTTTYLVFNPTSELFENVRITLTVPADYLGSAVTVDDPVGLTHISSGPPDYVWTAPAFDDGDVVTFTLVAQVNPAIADSRRVAATGQVVGTLNGHPQRVTDRATVRVDAEPPVSLITSPYRRDFARGSNLTVQGTAQDEISWVEQVEFYADDGDEWRTAEGTSAWLYEWPIPGADRTYTLTTRATDAVDHVETGNPGITVTVDNTPPTTVITDPVGFAAPVLVGGRNVITVSGTASDASSADRVSGVRQVYLMANDYSGWREAVSDTLTWSAWHYPLPLPIKRFERAYELTTQAEDNVGNVETAHTVTVTVDGTGPHVDIGPLPEAITGTTQAVLVIEGAAWDRQPQPSGRPGVWGKGSDQKLSSLHADDLAAHVPLRSEPRDGRGEVVVSTVGDVNRDGHDDFVVVSDVGVRWVGCTWGDRCPTPMPGHARPGWWRVTHRADLILGREADEWDALEGRIPLGSGSDVVAVSFLLSAAVEDLGEWGMSYAIPPVGLRVADAGDVNDDGYDDFLIASPQSGAYDYGQVYLFSGERITERAPRTVDVNAGAADSLLLASFAGKSDGANLGYVALGAGDVNGDGLDDVLLGGFHSDEFDNYTDVYVILGRATQDWPAFSRHAVDFADVRIRESGGVFGFWADAVGDTNDDERDDFVIRDTGMDGRDGFVLFLGQENWNTTPPQTQLGWSGSDAYWQPSGTTWWGDIAGLGDVNADGYADFAMALTDSGGSSEAGAVNVFLGRASWPAVISAPDVVFAGEDWTYTGQYLSPAGDVNDDGFDDFIVGARLPTDPITDTQLGDNTATAVFHLMMGGDLWQSTGVISSAHRSVTFYSPGEMWGDWLSMGEVDTGRHTADLGDVDADGFDDFVLATVQAYENRSHNAGPMHVNGYLHLFFGRFGIEGAWRSAGIEGVKVRVEQEGQSPPAWADAVLAQPGKPETAWVYTATLGMGRHTVAAYGVDQAGNTGTVVRSDPVLVDTDGFTLTLTWPADGATVPAGAPADFRISVDEGTIQDGVAEMWVLVDTGFQTETLSAFPTASGDWLSRWQPEFPPMQPIAYQACAVSEGGWEAETDSRTLNFSDTMGISWAYIQVPVAREYIGGVEAVLEGYISPDPFGDITVTIKADGTPLGNATISQTVMGETTWAYTWTLPITPAQYVLTTWADQGWMSQTNSIPVTVSVDAIPPTLTVTVPAETSLVLTGTEVVTFTGAVTDVGTGIEAVEVQAVAGEYWETAELTGLDWSYTWTVPIEDATFHPFSVRAVDLAGNTVSHTVAITVDRRAPRGLEGIVDSLDLGHWITSTETPTVVITWSKALTDRSGVVQTFATWSQVTGTVPITPTTGDYEHSEALTGPGHWHFHFHAVDAYGNSVTHHYGPLYVDEADYPGWAEVDGNVDTENGEWDPTREWLGTDDRPEVGPQSLYATWDADTLYLAWQGANWNTGGDLFFYLDTGSGGTATTWDYEGYGTHSLPFVANYVLFVEDGATWGLYQRAGTVWLPVSIADVAMVLGPDGGVEIALPWNSLGSPTSLGLLAFAQTEESSEVWAVLPAANMLGENVVFGVYYYWDNLGTGVVPSANQPEAVQLAVAMESAIPAQTTIGSGTTVPYTTTVHNGSTTATTVTLTATLSSGLTFGGSGQQTWNLGTLAAGATRDVVFSVTVDVVTGTVMPVTATVTVAATQPDVYPLDNAAALSHWVDTNPPNVDILHPAFTIRPGAQTVIGQAEDETNLEQVEVSADGATWESARGTAVWWTTVNAPGSGSVDLWVRAQDSLSNLSDPISRTYTVDDTPPTSTLHWTGDAVVSGDSLLLEGTAYDPFPTGGSIAGVNIAIGGTWIAAALLGHDSDGTVHWNYAWFLPSEGGYFTLRTYATDAAGNAETPGDGITIYVEPEQTGEGSIYLPLVMKNYQG